MADKHFTRKLEVYQALACVNEHFHALAHHVQDLGNTGLFPGPKMPTFKGLVRELQSQVSHFVLERMHTLEHKDMFESGKTRIERDHYLNADRPAFHSASPEPPVPPATLNPEVAG